ncbi:hypothetical protein GGR57DRAFT_519274 [Xylariaceae sp. FL1272]|nr:hypothetical protein GGR57DRAFT_519274 [Xylariaceae sp. FL1272]
MPYQSILACQVLSPVPSNRNSCNNSTTASLSNNERVAVLKGKPKELQLKNTDIEKTIFRVTKSPHEYHSEPSHAHDNDFNTMPQTRDHVLEIAEMLGRPEDETFEWLTSDLVVIPFRDWNRDSIMVQQSGSTITPSPASLSSPVVILGPAVLSPKPGAAICVDERSMVDLARVHKETVRFFEREIGKDEDIPVPTIEELSAVLGSHAVISPITPSSASWHFDRRFDTGRNVTLAVSLDDLVKRFVLSLLRVNLKAGGIWEEWDRKLGYARPIAVALRVSTLDRCWETGRVDRAIGVSDEGRLIVVSISSIKRVIRQRVDCVRSVDIAI